MRVDFIAAPLNVEWKSFGYSPLQFKVKKDREVTAGHFALNLQSFLFLLFHMGEPWADAVDLLLPPLVHLLS